MYALLLLLPVFVGRLEWAVALALRPAASRTGHFTPVAHQVWATFRAYIAYRKGLVRYFCLTVMTLSSSLRLPSVRLNNSRTSTSFEEIAANLIAPGAPRLLHRPNH